MKVNAGTGDDSWIEAKDPEGMLAETSASEIHTAGAYYIRTENFCLTVSFAHQISALKTKLNCSKA